MVSNRSSLWRSWQLQRRVIFALLMREALTRFGRHNIGFLWMFAEPMLFTVGVTVLWTVTGAAHGSHLPIAVFALTGYSAVLLWRNMPNRAIGAIAPNIALMFHRNVRIIDIFVARLMLEMAGATISFVILGIIFTYVEWIEPPDDFLKVVFAWSLLAWFGMALAIFMGALAEKSELIDRFWHPASYLMFPLSGAVFLVDSLPTAAQELALYVPMVNCVEYLRDGYFGSQFVAHYDIPYVIMVNTVLTFLALVQVKDIAGKVTPA